MSDELLCGLLGLLMGGLLTAAWVNDGIRPSELQEACTQTKMFIHGQDIYQCQLVVRDGRPL